MSESMWGVMWDDGHVETCPTRADAVARAEETDQDLIEIVFHA